MSKKGIKVNVLTRDEESFTRERKTDQYKVFQNLDPILHPFQKEREYTRALNAIKLERVFAKPFLFALDGHKDGVYSMSRVHGNLGYLLSGDGEGEMKLWNVSSRREIWTAKAHEGRVRGICTDSFGEIALSAGVDKTIKMWNIKQSVTDINNLNDKDMEESKSIVLGNSETERKSLLIKPTSVYTLDYSVLAIDHHKKNNQFVCGGSNGTVNLYDYTRTDPIYSFSWGSDSISTTKFNLIDTNILLATATDRAVVLYDVRQKTPLKKIIMQMNNNASSWNPMESYHFVLANEDGNCYTFDTRNVDKAVTVHRDHVNAVIHVDYAPTGKEFVTAGYDRSIRIFGHDQSNSREVYTAKRMQRVFSVLFSADNRYVFSGSDDTNIRAWKARASESLAVQTPREQAASNYQQALKQRYAHMPEIKRISKHRILPIAIHKQKIERSIMHASKKRKEENRDRTNRMKGKKPKPSEIEKRDPRKAKIVKIVK